MAQGNEIEKTPELQTKEVEERVIAKKVAVRQETIFSGPIPRAQDLAEYKKVQKDLPDRIVKMAEDDLAHIHFVQKMEVITDSIASIVGIGSAFALGMFTVYWGAQVTIGVSSLTGSLTGAFISTVGIGSIIATFIYGTRRSNSNNSEIVPTQQKEDIT